MDYRINITYEKKAQLLVVLKHPELPLHNNPAELEVRQRVRKRDISLQPRTKLGLAAWDTFQSLAATCRKLGCNFFEYLRATLTHSKSKRASGSESVKEEQPKLADLISSKAAQLALGASWQNEAARLPYHSLKIQGWLR